MDPQPASIAIHPIFKNYYPNPDSARKRSLLWATNIGQTRLPEEKSE
jgi:hypothetical protein